MCTIARHLYPTLLYLNRTGERGLIANAMGVPDYTRQLLRPRQKVSALMNVFSSDGS